MKGYYRDASDIATKLATNIGATVEVDDFFYQNRFSPIFDDPTWFKSDDYFLCKTIGAIPGTVYASVPYLLKHKITLTSQMFLLPAKQLNIISSDIFIPTKENTFYF